MDGINKGFKTRVSLFIVLALFTSILAHMSPVAIAKLSAPSIKSGKLDVGDTAYLYIKKNKKCTIKKVEAYPDLTDDVEVVDVTKSYISVKGINASDTCVYVYIVYKYPKKKAQSVLKKVKVKVVSSSETPKPDTTEAPSATPTVKPSATPTVTPVATPVASQTPKASVAPEYATGPLTVNVTCVSGKRDTDFGDEDIISYSLLERLISSVSLYDSSGKAVPVSAVRRFDYNIYKDRACTQPYDEGVKIEGGYSYIKVEVIIADDWRSVFEDSVGIGELFVETTAVG